MSLYETNFTAWDWGIVVVYLLTSIVIGLWANRNVGNLSDYLVAGYCLQKSGVFNDIGNVFFCGFMLIFYLLLNSIILLERWDYTWITNRNP